MSPPSPSAASQRLVATILPAALSAALVLSQLGVASAERGRRARFDVVDRGDTLASIAAEHDVRIDDLAAENGLRPDQPLSVGRKLRIPRGGPKRHVVRPGETAAGIAAAEGCSVSALLSRNKLGASARLDVGQVLVVPSAAPPAKGEAPRAERTHRVRKGEHLRDIAKRYGVTTKSLMRANGISNPRALREGQELVVPERRAASARISKGRRRISGHRRSFGVEHRVMDGQSWGTIARAYSLPVERLRKANPKLGPRIRAGDVVRVPGAKEVRPVAVGNCGYPGVPFAKGDRRETIRLLTCSGRVSKGGRRRLSALARKSGTSGGPLLHRRLVRLVQRVADEYPGRIIHVVSGYRPPGGPASESRHHHGQALDFSVAGVGRKALHTFCLTLPSTGCGYYPSSTFIHLDVRSKSASWIDYSGPGEPADYAPRDAGDPPAEGEPAPEPDEE